MRAADRQVARLPREPSRQPVRQSADEHLPLTGGGRPEGDAGADGLRLRDINIGSYGVVPDTWTLQNDAPRGTESTGQIIPAAYSIFDKAEVWSENAVDLYEEAIKHRWTPATDLDWEGGLSDLPEELERAVGQICTVYSNNGLVEQKIIGKWLEQISYGYHEPSCSWRRRRSTRGARLRRCASGR